MHFSKFECLRISRHSKNACLGIQRMHDKHSLLKNVYHGLCILIFLVTWRERKRREKKEGKELICKFCAF